MRKLRFIQVGKRKKDIHIFAAVVYDDRHLMYSFDNENVEDRKAFFGNLLRKQEV